MADDPLAKSAALPFLVADDPVDHDDTMGVFRRGEREVTLRPIPVDVLRQNLTAAVAGLRAAFDEVAQDTGKLRLREVQVGFEITASGGVNFIGTAEMSTKGAITLTFSE